jgi:hypothetical protein
MSSVGRGGAFFALIPAFAASMARGYGASDGGNRNRCQKESRHVQIYCAAKISTQSIREALAVAKDLQQKGQLPQPCQQLHIDSK